uniref:Uncharacterized protein TP009.8 n=1 Tax=Halorubrum sp. TP009 TaxID=447099 RepID=A7U0X4_9EURY|nr:hypothetical protein [Halorubrum sp. TP009]
MAAEGGREEHARGTRRARATEGSSERGARLGRCEAAVLCGAGLKGAVAGSGAAGCPWRVAPRCREGEARRRKHRRERTK